eukprot:CAMPEP_0172432398 /NCGR_PEP_ID=MMETSP1064-20121228/63106_1 /TAXON_ID=202472 /ORGANISM="Aulacoseira subarctica , Strain CCAP 1002/5" /LENGTH=33 /DNA_ID= /DNA_START= /DNA_END= /DNA_ORIENTATION=
MSGPVPEDDYLDNRTAEQRAADFVEDEVNVNET